MQSDDALCIKYLMNELDPTEITMVEKMMESDPNFLIEVECTRKMLQRLNKLPNLSPPELLVDQLCTRAAQHRRQLQQPLPVLGRVFSDIRYAGAAAVLIIGVSAGSWMMFRGPGENGAEAAVSFRVPAASQAGTVAGNSAWVDRNDVLSIQNINTNGRASDAATDSSVVRSMQKLKALNEDNLNPKAQSPDIELAREKQ